MALFTVLYALVMAAPPSPPSVVAPAVGTGWHALLVGCTRYPHLPAEQQLAGPGNDVLLIRDLLRERFDFPAAQIVSLTEGMDGARLRPIRANIEREFQRLAATVGAGDQVVIFLAGHGSQQPDDDPTDTRDLEPDGLDEIFCPADIEEATEDQPDRVRNAITDDEIRVWLERILDRGAAVCLLVDACHSGTMGRNLEQGREIPASQLVKESRLQRARELVLGAAGNTRGGKLAPANQEMPRSAKGSFVALYASQADERTVEKRFPPDDVEGHSYGLLTYTLSGVLRQSRTPLTYRELVSRIHGRYVQMGRTSPTPLLEGDGLDREVLGSRKQPGRSRIALQRERDGTYRINAGTLHDVMPGTILAVFPQTGEAQDGRSAGHVRVVRAGVLSSSVEPCGYGDSPVSALLPGGGRCEVVNPAYGVRRLRVALDPEVQGGRAVALQDRQRVQNELKVLAESRVSLFELVVDPRQADWLVRLRTSAGACQVDLVPVGAGLMRDATAETSQWGPVVADGQLGKWLEQRLDRVARATNLLRLAEAVQSETAGTGSNMNGNVQFLKLQDEHDVTGKPVVWQAEGLAVSVDDLVAFRVHNKGRSHLDATLLFIDSNYGIELYFPEAGQSGDGRLAPGATLTTPIAKVNSSTLGLEHMIVILIKAKPEQMPLDLGFLAQSSQERARAGGLPSQATRSPLGELFNSALDPSILRRSVKSPPADYELRVFSWRAKSH